MPARKVYLTEDEIIYACENTNTINQAAQFLRVSYVTFAKYADMYYYDQEKGITWKDYQRNYGGKGNPKRSKETGQLITGGPAAVCKQFLEGKRNLRRDHIPEVLIRQGHKLPQCERCGYDTFRKSDYRQPFLANFKDGNTKNVALENIEILCYNCTFEVGEDIPMKRTVFGARTHKTHNRKEI